jgi:hypothetical protein
MKNTRGKRLLPTDNAPEQRRRMSWRQVAQEAVDHYWNENSPIKTSLLPSTLLETMPERRAKHQRPLARGEDGESRARARERERERKEASLRSAALFEKSGVPDADTFKEASTIYKLIYRQ